MNKSLFPTNSDFSIPLRSSDLAKSCAMELSAYYNVAIKVIGFQDGREHIYLSANPDELTSGRRLFLKEEEAQNKKFSVEVQWATKSGEFESTSEYVFAQNSNEAMEKLSAQVRKEKNFWKTRGASAAEVRDHNHKA